VQPTSTLALLLPGYGATAEQPLLVALGAAIEARGIAVRRLTVTERGRRPDATLSREVAALRLARDEAAGKRLALVGRSFGGRVCTLLAAQEPPAALVVLGYPLRPPGKRRVNDEQALAALRCPTLIVQGDRDELGPLEVVRSVSGENPNIEVRVVTGAGHALRERQSRIVFEDVAAWLAQHLR
jgi:uncharacterized protein